MNISLLTDVKYNILAVPETFDIREWLTDNINAPCETTGCIAGHAVAVVNSAKSLRQLSEEFYKLDIPAMAMAALELKYEQKQRLFYIMHWPIKFQTAYIERNNAEHHAQVTADRIDHFIKTNGAE